MLAKILMLLVFFGCMIAVGVYARKSTSSMTDFVLGGTKRWPLADCICLWNILFFCCCICRLCRTIWMEVWFGIYLDWSW